jgi:hypothetical protein
VLLIDPCPCHAEFTMRLARVSVRRNYVISGVRFAAQLTFGKLSVFRFVSSDKLV